MGLAFLFDYQITRDAFLTNSDVASKSSSIVDRDSKEYQEWMSRVQTDGSILRIAPDWARNDRSIVLTACNVHGPALEYASEGLRKDKRVIMVAIQNEPWALQFASFELTNDNDIILAAVSHKQKYRWALKIASPELQEDKSFVLEVVEKSGRALQFASEDLQNDSEVVLTAVQQDGRALDFASPFLRQDEQIVLAAVQQIDSALKFASKELRADKDVVLTALVLSTIQDEDDIALAYASEELRNDLEIVMAAVEQNGLTLQCVSPQLCQNKEVVLAAIKSNPDARKYANANLRNQRDILIAAGMFFKENSSTQLIQAQRGSTPTSATKKKLIVTSTRLTSEPKCHSDAINFISMFQESKYITTGNFQLCPLPSNDQNKKNQSCDPQWIDIDHPCRGTQGTCRFDKSLKTGHPSDQSCWRYALRYHLQESKSVGGFMLLLVERGVLFGPQMLGRGQQIEEDIASRVGIKIFRVYRPVNKNSGYELWFDTVDVAKVVAAIRQWYDGGCKDMSVCTIHLYHKES